MNDPTLVCSSRTVSEIWEKFSEALRATPDSQFTPSESDISNFEDAYTGLPPKILTLSEISDPRVSAPFLLLTRFVSDEEFPAPTLLALGEKRLKRSQTDLLREISNGIGELARINGLQSLSGEFYRDAEMHFLNSSCCPNDRAMNAAFHYRNGFIGLHHFSTMTINALSSSEVSLQPVDLLRLRKFSSD